MANWCLFDMKVAGREKNNCMAFYEMLKKEPTWETDEVQIAREGMENGFYFMELYGECKWSVLNAMDKRENRTKSKTLKEESKRLSLEIDVYGTESSDCFAEHIRYKNGKRLTDDCVDYEEYYWDKAEYPTIEAYNEAHHTDFTEEDFDIDGYHYDGGFNDWSFFTAA